jgi:hypothetical protein
MWLLFKWILNKMRGVKTASQKLFPDTTYHLKTVLLSLFLILLNTISFSKQDTSPFNPVFKDSILNNKTDSAKWQSIVQFMDIHKSADKNKIIQKYKADTKSPVFLYISVAVLLLLLLMRLLFDDFSFSLLEGIWSFKQFLIYYQSKKYDSLIAVIFVYLLNLSVLSMVTYIGLEHFLKNDYTQFNTRFFLKILIALSVFFSAKNILELIFNRVIEMQQSFKAFFLQNLFAEFVLSFILLFLLLIYIYNPVISSGFAAFLLVFSLVLYIVFNTIRSYQLMDNVRIPYKLHFFLYICAFKIIPMLILAKYILKNVVA